MRSGREGEGVDVVVQANRRRRVVSVCAAVALAAATALDPHDVVCDAVSLRTAEAQAYGASLRRATASAVSARAACFGPVPPGCSAATERDALRLSGPPRPSAFLSRLRTRRRQTAV